MSKEIGQILEYLDAIRLHPKMHFLSDDEPKIVKAHLDGARSLASKLLGFDGYYSSSVMDEAATRRGYWYYADGIIPALRRKGLTNKEIVAELIETEIEYWKIYDERSAAA